MLCLPTKGKAQVGYSLDVLSVLRHRGGALCECVFGSEKVSFVKGE